MTEELTLRERVLEGMETLAKDGFGPNVMLHYVANLLEDTGAPAHMRVAAELRGE